MTGIPYHKAISKFIRRMADIEYGYSQGLDTDKPIKNLARNISKDCKVLKKLLQLAHEYEQKEK